MGLCFRTGSRCGTGSPPPPPLTRPPPPPSPSPSPTAGSSCNGGSVSDLARLRSPLSGDTSGSGDNYELSCGGHGNEAIFSLQLQPGQSVEIGMDSNTYDSRHETSWGGSCPGQNVVACTDDPDTTRHQWTNDQGSVQTVFFVIDAYSSGSGTFTLSWTISGGSEGGGGPSDSPPVPPPPVPLPLPLSGSNAGGGHSSNVLAMPLPPQTQIAVACDEGSSCFQIAFDTSTALSETTWVTNQQLPVTFQATAGLTYTFAINQLASFEVASFTRSAAYIVSPLSRVATLLL